MIIACLLYGLIGGLIGWAVALTKLSREEAKILNELYKQLQKITDLAREREEELATIKSEILKRRTSKNFRIFRHNPTYRLTSVYRHSER